MQRLLTEEEYMTNKEEGFVAGRTYEVASDKFYFDSIYWDERGDGEVGAVFKVYEEREGIAFSENEYEIADNTEFKYCKVVVEVEEGKAHNLAVTQPDVKEVTGGSSPNYYRKSLSLPTTEDRSVFVEVDLEAGDVSDAWSCSGNQFNVLKSVLRGDNKEGVDLQYALDKQLWFSLREKMKLGMITHKQFWEQAVALGLAEEK